MIHLAGFHGFPCLAIIVHHHACRKGSLSRSGLVMREIRLLRRTHARTMGRISSGLAFELFELLALWRLDACRKRHVSLRPPVDADLFGTRAGAPAPTSVALVTRAALHRSAFQTKTSGVSAGLAHLPSPFAVRRPAVMGLVIHRRPQLSPCYYPSSLCPASTSCLCFHQPAHPP